MCTLLTASRTIRGEEKRRRINREGAMLSASLLMKEEVEPKRNVPSGIIF